jgi:hypothetical protein
MRRNWSRNRASNQKSPTCAIPHTYARGAREQIALNQWPYRSFRAKLPRLRRDFVRAAKSVGRSTLRPLGNSICRELTRPPRPSITKRVPTGNRLGRSIILTRTQLSTHTLHPDAYRRKRRFRGRKEVILISCGLLWTGQITKTSTMEVRAVILSIHCP